jgi:hypothetical protein
MNAQEIIRNLQLLGEELEAMQVQEPVELLLIGGGFMLTQIKNRTFTGDIDVMVIRPDAYSELYRIFKEAARFVAHDEGLDSTWLSTNIGDFLRIAGPLPKLKLWRKFGPLHLYLPPKDFILAHKFVAGRPKDMDDIHALCCLLRVTDRGEAQKILDKYISQEIQSHYHVETTLRRLFP